MSASSPSGSCGEQHGSLQLVVRHVSWETSGVPGLAAIRATVGNDEFVSSGLIEVAPALGEPLHLAVLCPEHMFTQYLQNAQTASLVVEDKVKQTAFGVATVPVGSLTPGTPVHGTFPILEEPTGRCLGKVQLEMTCSFSDIQAGPYQPVLHNVTSEKQVSERCTANPSEIEMDDFLEQLEMADEPDTTDMEYASGAQRDLLALIHAAFKRYVSESCHFRRATLQV